MIWKMVCWSCGGTRDYIPGTPCACGCRVGSIGETEAGARDAQAQFKALMKSMAPAAQEGGDA